MSKRTVFVGLGLFILAFAVRLPYLGTFLTIDEIKWLEGAGQFLQALHSRVLADTYWHFHPGITITWGEAIILWLQYLTSHSTDLSIYVADRLADLPGMVGSMRLSGALITAAAIVGIYVLARPLLGQRASLLGSALLAADPFFSGHSRIVNGDAGVAAFMMLALLAFAHLWRVKSWRMVILSGAMAGLALLTKIPAVFIFPWIALMAGYGFIRDRHFRFWLMALVAVGLTAAFVFVAVWPAMWIAPVNTLRLLIRDSFEVGELGTGHETFFLGQVWQDPGWLFYPYIIAFRLTPVIVIGLAAAGLWLWWSRRDQAGQSWKRTMAITLLIYAIFIMLCANISPKKSDRYIMAVIPALVLIAAIGFDGLLERAERLTEGRSINGKDKEMVPSAIMSGAAALILGSQLFYTISSYPYLISFYNPLMGGYRAAIHQIPVAWGEGIEQSVAWINAQPNANTLRVTGWYNDIVRLYARGETVSFSSDGEEQLSADYVIFYINQQQRHKPNQALLNYFSQRQPVFQVQEDGAPLAWVYAGPRMQFQASGQAMIEGRAKFLGYSWKPGSPTKAGESVGLTVFLHTLGPLPANETLEFRLISADGQIYGRWQSVVRPDWPPDAIVEWTGVLVLPQETLPGDYQLVVQLIDTNLNSEVTRYVFVKSEIQIRPSSGETGIWLD